MSDDDAIRRSDDPFLDDLEDANRLQDDEQLSLFDVSPSWEKEWRGMPEFVQANKAAWKSIIVHFANREDMRTFGALVEQTITFQTQSIWYPKARIERYMDKRYVDES